MIDDDSGESMEPMEDVPFESELRSDLNASLQSPHDAAILW